MITELVEGDLDKSCVMTTDGLKLPVMPSNVNVLIDVFKDVLYVLETNTNSALLTLLVNCFSYHINPVTKLSKHVEENIKNKCKCDHKEEFGECLFVNEFDLYNERLLQIGFFAISCSTDQKRKNIFF